VKSRGKSLFSVKTKGYKYRKAGVFVYLKPFKNHLQKVGIYFYVYFWL